MAKNKRDNQKVVLVILLRELFYVLAGACFIFILLEVIRPGVVLAYININLILLLWLFVGILVVLLGARENKN